MVVDEQASGILDPQFGSFVKTKPEKRRRQGDLVHAGNMHRFEARLPLDHPPCEHIRTCSVTRSVRLHTERVLLCMQECRH